MEQYKFENQPKRNFLEVLNSLGENRDFLERKKAMQIGDYIDMPYQEFLLWTKPKEKVSLFKDTKKVIKCKLGTVRISIIEIKKGGEKILVQSGNVKKEIDSSLFFDYSRS